MFAIYSCLFRNASTRIAFPLAPGLLGLALALSGCTSAPFLSTAPTVGSRLSGKVHGGQQPIAGASLQLYAIGSGTNGSSATALLAQPAISDSSGSFNLPSYTCPSAASEVYLVASGGNPGFGTGSTNPNLSLMSALGPCGALNDSTFVQINEVTTIGSIWPLANYMNSASQVGAASSSQFTSDRNTVYELVSIANGNAPGPNLPAGSLAPISKLNTLANLLAGCVNSRGGVAGDGSVCGSLFSATTPAGGSPPTDTLSAALQLAKNPTSAPATLINLIPGQSPFQPMMAAPPPDWTLTILNPPAAPQITPVAGSYSALPTVTISDTTSGASLFYTLDGSVPSATSTPYRGPFLLPAAGKVNAIAVANTLSSPVSSATYNVVPLHLVFLSQPTSTPASALINPAVQVAVENASGTIVSATSGSASLSLASGNGILSGTTVASFSNGIASFPSLSISTPGSGYALSASSTGLDAITSSSFSIGAPALSLKTSIALLKVGHTVTSTFILGQPAPAGGLSVTLTSSAPGTISIYPSVATVNAGASSGSYTYSSVTPGAASLTASAPGYTSANLAVSSSPNPVPATYFGMSINKPQYETLNMPYTFGTTRSWDVYPELDWGTLNPSPGVYNFAPLDNWLAYNAANSNADVVYTLGRTPQWASSQPNTAGDGGPGTCAPPANLQNWDNYLTAIVTHTLGRVHLWELWNEPQDPGYYCGDIPTMIALAQHAQQVIKSIDPSAIILSPSPVGGLGPQWMNAFLQAGGGNYVDVLAFHGYWSGTAEDLVPVLANLRAVMSANNVASKPLWDTEADWYAYNPPTDLSQQAAFLMKYYLLHWSLGVDRFIWYEYDGGVFGALWNPTSGILPAGVAYGQAKNWLLGADLATACIADSSSTYTCDLTRSNGYRARVIWNSTNTFAYTPDASFHQSRNLTGAVTSLTGGAITIGNEPLLLETGTSPYPN